MSKFQTGCGIVDIMMHTLERYLTPEGGESDITDRIAEGLLIACAMPAAALSPIRAIMRRVRP